VTPPRSLRLAAALLQGQASRAWLFVFCIALGVAARVSVGAFLWSLDASLLRESRSLLAADLEVGSAAPLSPAQAKDLDSLLPPGSRISRRVSLLTMASTQGPQGRRGRLVQLSAVDGAYPLAGTLAVSGTSAAEGSAALQGKRRIFCQPELLRQLGLGLGGTLRLGGRDFKVAGVIHEIPGLGGAAFALGPRVLVGAGEAQAAGLTGFGSRVLYESSVLLPDPAMAQGLAESLRQRWKLPEEAGHRGQPPPPGVLRVSTAKQAQSDLRRFFERLADFLNLVSLAALLLGGVGVASVTRAFVREAAVPMGILRSLGAGPRQTLAVFLWQSLGLGLAGGLAGSAAGLLAQRLLPGLLAGLLPLAVAPGLAWGAAAWGVALGLMVALSFGLDPVLSARRQSPASLLRDEDPPESPGLAGWGWRLGCLCAFTALAALEARSWTRGPAALGGLVLGALLLGWMGQALLPWLGRLARAKRLRNAPFALRQPLANLARPGLRAGSSLVALGSAALLLGVLAVYQHSLLVELAPAMDSGKLPQFFLMDLQKEQMAPLRALCVGADPQARLRAAPIVKGRYLGRLGEAAAGATATTPAAQDDQAMRSREQNLSWRDSLDDSETLVAGRWMDPKGDQVEASLEEWFAQRLGAKLGDTLRFDVQGVEVQAKVTSLRKVRWMSLQPNFFVLLSPWALQDAPQSWVASLAGVGDAGERDRLQGQVLERFPNVTLIDVAETAAKVLALVEKIAAAVRLVAWACLLTGLMVLAGLGLAQARARRGEAALLKALGARQGQLLWAWSLEFGLLAAQAAGLGLGLSLGFGWMLLTWLLDLPYQVPWALMAALWALFSLCGAGVGLLSGWRLFRARAAELLREE
jgi:putative ABC transport system permease protein